MDASNSAYYKFLLSLTKDEINHIRKLFHCDDDVPSTLRKQEMALGVADYMLNESEYWMRMLPMNELQILEELLNHKPGYEFNAGYEPYPTLLDDYGIATVEYDKCGSSIYSLDPDMYKALKYGMHNAIGFILCKDCIQYEMYARGALNLYGVIRCDRMYDILRKAEKVIEEEYGESGVQPGHLVYISESLLLNAYMIDYDGESYFFHPSVEDPEEFIEEQLSRPQLDYKTYTVDEIREASANPPFITVGMDQPWGKDLLALAKRFATGSFIDVPDYDNYFIEAQYGIKEFISASVAEMKFSSMDDANRFVGKLNEFSNRIPHWKLKGWSPVELSAQRSPGFLPGQMGVFNPSGFVRKVGRNDPCPCGSGRKYKDCHGKYQS